MSAPAPAFFSSDSSDCGGSSGSQARWASGATATSTPTPARSTKGGEPTAERRSSGQCSIVKLPPRLQL
ncbi:uncharacterized protein LOC144106795 isoform X2 [Amblyomma americanum]